MTVTIKYFGSIAEKTGTKEEAVTLDGEEYDLEALKQRCFSKYGFSEMESVKTAVNQSIESSGMLKDGDEVAFLPPFAGG
ncbi:MoaD/ThiS family protein [Halalkalibaculum sp. DA3122]|uniref:MoaD/ThiS family protein n=1 Tax=Halalkalibaculum sp. DA3122 TaxID=3373607 RepID=UPI003753E8F5